MPLPCTSGWLGARLGMMRSRTLPWEQGLLAASRALALGTAPAPPTASALPHTDYSPLTYTCQRMHAPHHAANAHTVRRTTRTCAPCRWPPSWAARATPRPSPRCVRVYVCVRVRVCDTVQALVFLMRKRSGEGGGRAAFKHDSVRGVDDSVAIMQDAAVAQGKVALHRGACVCVPGGWCLSAGPRRQHEH